MIDLDHVRSLEVSLEGQRIGVIARLANDRIRFDFEPEYVDDPNRPTLSLVVFDDQNSPRVAHLEHLGKTGSPGQVATNRRTTASPLRDPD